MATKHYVSLTTQQGVPFGIWSGPYETEAEATTSAQHAQRLGHKTFEWSETEEEAARSADQKKRALDAYQLKQKRKRDQTSS